MCIHTHACHTLTEAVQGFVTSEIIGSLANFVFCTAQEKSWTLTHTVIEIETAQVSQVLRGQQAFPLCPS